MERDPKARNHMIVVTSSQKPIFNLCYLIVNIASFLHVNSGLPCNFENKRISWAWKKNIILVYQSIHKGTGMVQGFIKLFCMSSRDRSVDQNGIFGYQKSMDLVQIENVFDHFSKVNSIFLSGKKVKKKSIMYSSKFSITSTNKT